MSIFAGSSNDRPLSWALKRRRMPFFVSVIAIVPLLFGNFFHELTPCAVTQCCAEDVHDPGDPDHDEHDRNASASHDESCPICVFLAMPRDLTAVVHWDGFSSLIERRERPLVRFLLVLYHSFVFGRAPPTVA